MRTYPPSEKASRGRQTQGPNFLRENVGYVLFGIAWISSLFATAAHTSRRSGMSGLDVSILSVLATLLIVVPLFGGITLTVNRRTRTLHARFPRALVTPMARPMLMNDQLRKAGVAARKVRGYFTLVMDQESIQLWDRGDEPAATIPIQSIANVLLASAGMGIGASVPSIALLLCADETDEGEMNMGMPMMVPSRSGLLACFPKYHPSASEALAHEISHRIEQVTGQKLRSVEWIDG